MNCPHCAEEFSPRTHGGNAQVYCSKRCRVDHNQAWASVRATRASAAQLEAARRWKAEHAEENRSYQAEYSKTYRARRRRELTRQKYRGALQRRYGLSSETYDALVTAQCGRCAICDDSSDLLVVDHCHRTGAVRGLICDRCNVGLGRFRDDPALIKAAVAYLRRAA